MANERYRKGFFVKKRPLRTFFEPLQRLFENQQHLKLPPAPNLRASCRRKKAVRSKGS